MKKMKVLAAVIAMGLLAAGCGQSAEQETAPMESIEETADYEKGCKIRWQLLGQRQTV